jgi:uncharacterized protein YukE
MADQRRVDVGDLHSAGSQVAQEKVLLNGVHTETATAVSVAQTGWVGSSSAALSEVTARWHTLAQAHSAAIGKHSRHLHAAAQHFGDTEDNNAAAVAEVGAAGPDTA